MSFDPKFALEVIYPAANAAYLAMNLESPALPAGYTMVGKIVADQEHAAKVMAEAAIKDPTSHRTVNVMLNDSHIFGLVAFNDAEKTALVAFRGTKTPVEWLADFDAAPVPFDHEPEAGGVHMGFQLLFEHIHPSFAELLQKCVGATRILVTGHSLGGAIAELAAFDIVSEKLSEVAPELYTLAQPRVGGPVFAHSFNKHISICFRVVNFLDTVPQVPLPPIYLHVGQEVLIHGGFRPLDITYAHHLTTYLAGLTKLVPVAKPAAAGAAGGQTN